MRSEFHITVNGDPFQWRGWCIRNGIKPLWIELNNFNRQLMCAITGDDMRQACIPQAMIDAGDVTPYTRDIVKAGFEILRVKHEVEPGRIDVTNHGDIAHKFIVRELRGACYYECHVKFDGPFKPFLPMTSRDLFRADRWYATFRAPQPFDFAGFVHEMCAATPDCTYAGFEFEACLHDSNVMLDKGWR